MTYFVALVIFVFSRQIGTIFCFFLKLNRCSSEKTVIGICVSVILSTLIFKINLAEDIIFQVSFFCLLLTSAVFAIRDIRRNKREFLQTELKNLLFLLSVVAIFNLVYAGDISGNSIRQRVGPDLLGWMASAQYFESNSSIDPLEKWLDENFPKHHYLDPFRKEQFGTRNSIYYTDQYTKQLQAEFLIGGSRTGLPSWLAAWARVFPDKIEWKHLYLGATALFQFLLLSLMVQGKAFRNRITMISLAIMVSSYAVLFPTFEGSFGQHFSMVIFLYILKNFARLSKVEFTVILFAIYVSYVDFFFFSIPFFILFFLCIQREKVKGVCEVSKSLKLRIGLPSLIVFSLLLWLLDPARRLSSLSFGGWSEGWLPSILDFFGVGGFYTWAGVEKSKDSYIITLCFFTILLLWYLFRKHKSYPIFTWNLVGMSTFYALLLLISWMFKNDYVLWKSLPFFSIYIANLLVTRTVEISRILTRSSLRVLVFCQILSMIMFSYSWLKSSTTIQTYNLTGQEKRTVEDIVNKYALDFREMTYINTYALLGDMSWGTPARQISNQPTNVSARQIATVIPPRICKESKDKSPILFLNQNICIVSVSS